MKHLREFIYDKSDILVALVILLIAALVIFWRFEAIADYPSTLVDIDSVKSAKEPSEKHKTKDETKDKEKASEKNSTDSKTENNDKDSSDLFSDGVTKKDANISVQSGSAIEAAESLVSLGYFSSYDDFVSICNNAGIDSNSIKAGNFNIPAGSSKADIARIVCQ